MFYQILAASCDLDIALNYSYNSHFYYQLPICTGTYCAGVSQVQNSPTLCNAGCNIKYHCRTKHEVIIKCFQN